MKIRFSNLGPIKRGQIDLSKRVNVFVGYNNSGKTYTSHLIWNLIKDRKTVSNRTLLTPELETTYKNGESIDITKEYVESLLNNFLNSIQKNLTKSFNSTTHEVAGQFSLSPNEDIHKVFLSAEYTHAVLLVGRPDEENNQDPAIEDQEISSLRELLVLHKEKNSSKITIQLTADKIKYIRVIMRKDPSIDDYSRLYVTKSYKSDNIPKGLISRAISSLILSIFIDKKSEPFFLPANRMFYPSFNKYIFSVTKDERDLMYEETHTTYDINKIRNISKRPYTKTADDLIDRIYFLDNKQPSHKDHLEILSELRDLLGGDIIVSNGEGYAPVEFHLKLKNELLLDMHLASSSANQLTMLYIYFKYWARAKNNVLFIDEPEENLHPEHQIHLIRTLIKFANINNNKVYITTHSSLIAETINNYIHIGLLKNKTDNQYNMKDIEHLIDTNIELKPSDYGIYFFSGHQINEVNFNSYGAHFKQFKETEEKVSSLSTILKEKIYNIENSHDKPVSRE